MATINELIAQAEQRVSEATTDEARQAAQQELDRLKWARSQGLLTGQQAGSERDSGRSAGEQAQREAMAQRLGVPVDQLDAELERIEQERRDRQSQEEALRERVTNLETETESQRQARERAEAQVDRYRVDEAITHALDNRASREGAAEGDGNLRPGKRGMALSILRERVSRDENGNLTGVTEAVETLAAEEPGWFGDTLPPVPPQTPPRRQEEGTGGGSYARRRKDKGKK